MAWSAHITLVGALTLLWWTPPVLAQDRWGFDYSIDAGLVYLDHLKRPNTSIDNIPYSDRFSNKQDQVGEATKNQASPEGRESRLIEEVPRGRPRTLGLRHFKVRGSVENLPHSALQFVLRPDALTDRERGEPIREFDGRAGEGYRAKPTVTFLDTYSFEFNLYPGARIGLGVYDELGSQQGSYDSPLEFGLTALFPQKFTAAVLKINASPDPLPTAQDFNPTHHYKVWIYQGRDDRGESYIYQDSSYDYGPSAQDPYTGMAFDWQVDLDQTSAVFGVIGYGDTKVTGGRVNELFAQLAYSKKISLFDLPTHMATEYRISRERFHVTQSGRETLNQQSLFVTQKIDWRPQQSFGLGVHLGTSERQLPDQARKEKLQGWQFDLGYIYQVNEQFYWQSFIAYENRSNETADNHDGFVTIDGLDSTSYLMRFALELRYQLN